MESQEASIAIVDYGAGNLTSVKNAFAALGVETVVTRDPAVVAAAARVVFPGVGAALSAMESLRSLGLESAVKDAAASGRPFLGICLGMQILFEHSEEDGGVATLGVLPGRVRRFPKVPGVKVPQIGWNSVALNHEPRITISTTSSTATTSRRPPTPRLSPNTPASSSPRWFAAADFGPASSIPRSPAAPG